MSKIKEQEEYLFDSFINKDLEEWELDETEISTGEKLDIKTEMQMADLRYFDFRKSLKPELQKQLDKSMYTNMRWMSAVDDRSSVKVHMLMIVNELLNIDYTVISKHPEFFWKLMAACGFGEVERHNWIVPAKKKRILNTIDNFLLQWYPSANDMELEIINQAMTREQFEEFVKSTGAPDDQLRELLAAHDQQRGRTPEKAPSKAKKRKA